MGAHLRVSHWLLCPHNKKTVGKKQLSENNQVRVVITHLFKEHADFSIKNQQRVIKSMAIPGSD
jgi:hypothetical protein